MLKDDECTHFSVWASFIEEKSKWVHFKFLSSDERLHSTDGPTRQLKIYVSTYWTNKDIKRLNIRPTKDLLVYIGRTKI